MWNSNLMPKRALEVAKGIARKGRVEEKRESRKGIGQLDTNFCKAGLG